MSNLPARSGAACLALVILAGCSPIQSTLHPTGAEAERISTLFWIMAISGGLIFAGVMLATAMALFGSDRLRGNLSNSRWIIGAGIAFPVVVLTILLIYGLFVMRAGASAPLQEGTRRVAISGEQWWWRVSYTDAAGNRVDSANELHVPVGEPVSLELSSPDVIHSFWAPRLAGKLDMIPGRTNILTLTATKASISRGQCAEYCGGAHAFMSFYIVAQSPAEFDAWLQHEAAPASQPQGETAQRGQAVFQAAGCGGCHAVRGTGANGAIAPDLTHVGGRMSLAAAMLPNDAEAFSNWIVNNQHIKPENRMPAYQIFDEADLAALSLYLEGLK